MGLTLIGLSGHLAASSWKPSKISQSGLFFHVSQHPWLFPLRVYQRLSLESECQLLKDRRCLVHHCAPRIYLAQGLSQLSKYLVNELNAYCWVFSPSPAGQRAPDPQNRIFCFSLPLFKPYQPQYAPKVGKSRVWTLPLEAGGFHLPFHPFPCLLRATVDYIGFPSFLNHIWSRSSYPGSWC